MGPSAPVAHRNVGNTCRFDAYPLITGDYVLYLDDDNHYHIRSRALLADAILRMDKRPNWGIFPMMRLGRRFFNMPPGVNQTDTGQFFHRPVIRRRPIRFPDVNLYNADGMFVEQLKKYCEPAFVDPGIPLVNMPIRSFGLVTEEKERVYDYSVVILNRYPDIIAPLLESIALHEPPPLPKILIVTDGHDNGCGYEHTRYDREQFIFSHAANIGFRHTEPDDVILLNDDIRLLAPTFRQLRAAMDENPEIGILSPLIDGGVGNEKQYAMRIRGKIDIPKFTFSDSLPEDYICFPMVYLRRKMLDEIGEMDESLVTYGRDDADLCMRAKAAGWKAAVLNRVVVKHGHGGELGEHGRNWSASYARCPELHDSFLATGRDRLNDKYQEAALKQ
jgi:GT2 family glycosyltransferase